MDNQPCHAGDASSDASGLSSGAASLTLEQVKFLSVAVMQLTEGMNRNNQLMARLIVQVGVLIDSINDPVDDSDSDDGQPLYDLAGRRINDE